MTRFQTVKDLTSHPAFIMKTNQSISKLNYFKLFLGLSIRFKILRKQNIRLLQQPELIVKSRWRGRLDQSWGV